MIAMLIICPSSPEEAQQHSGGKSAEIPPDQLNLNYAEETASGILSQPNLTAVLLAENGNESHIDPGRADNAFDNVVSVISGARLAHAKAKLSACINAELVPDNKDAYFKSVCASLNHEFQKYGGWPSILLHYARSGGSGGSLTWVDQLPRRILVAGSGDLATRMGGFLGKGIAENLASECLRGMIRAAGEYSVTTPGGAAGAVRKAARRLRGIGKDPNALILTRGDELCRYLFGRPSWRVRKRQGAQEYIGEWQGLSVFECWRLVVAVPTIIVADLHEALEKQLQVPSVGWTEDKAALSSIAAALDTFNEEALVPDPDSLLVQARISVQTPFVVSDTNALHVVRVVGEAG